MAVLIRLPAIWMRLGLLAALVISFCSAETVVGEPHAVDPSILTPSESSGYEQDQTLASSNIEENAVEAGNDFGSHPAGLPVVSGPSSGIQYEEYNQMSEEFDRLMSQNAAQAEIESVVESFEAQNAFEEAAPTEPVVNYPMNQENRNVSPDIVAQDAVPVWEPEHQSDNQNVNQNNVDSTMSSFEETIVEQDSSSDDAESHNEGDFPEQEATGGNYANPIHSQAIADATKPGSTCSREVTCVRGAPSDQCFAHQLLCLQRLGLLPDEEADASDDDDDSAEEGEGEDEDEEETEIPPREEMQTRRHVQTEDVYEFDGQAFETQAAAVYSVVYLLPGLLTAVTIVGYNQLQLKYNLTPLTFQSTFGPSVVLLFVTSCSLLGWIFITSIEHEVTNIVQRDEARRAFARSAYARYCEDGQEKEIPQALYDSLDLFGKSNCYQLFQLVSSPLEQVNYFEAMSKVLAAGVRPTVDTAFGKVSGMTFFLFWAFSTIVAISVSLVALSFFYGFKIAAQAYLTAPKTVVAPPSSPPRLQQPPASARDEAQSPEQRIRRPFDHLASRDDSGVATSDSEADSPSTASKGSRSSKRLRKATTRLDL